MKAAEIYYPRIDASFTIVTDNYTDLVRLLSELRGCVVEDITEVEEFKEFEDEE